MIRTTGLTKRYGSTTVLDDFSLEVPDGESVALWGPNGAGKTTVVRCILGLVRYLLGSDADYVTGQVLTVAGGLQP